MSEWQPVKTVPTDDTVVDLWWQTDWDEAFRVPDCRYRNEDSFVDERGNIIDREYITHWMPVPEPPDRPIAS